MTIAETITRASGRLAAAGISTARLDAEVLLAYVIKKDRAWLIIHGNDNLDSSGQKLFEDTISRRSRREPLQYITGKQEFWGLEFLVTPDVLIPRPETELIVETAIRAVKEAGSRSTIADLCTGSGCIAVSLAKETREARIFATDASEQALAIARENARRHGVSGRIRFLEGDLFGPLEELDVRGGVDIITANPPYIPSGELAALQPEVRDYEPGIALTAGPEGIEIQREIITASVDFLNKRGVLIMEMGIHQAAALRSAAEDTGSYAVIEIYKDLAGIDRVIVARKR